MRRPRQPALQQAPARARSLTLQTANRARRAKRELLVLLPLVAAVIAAYIERERIFGLDTPVRVGAAVALLMLGWAVARDIGRFSAPALFRRMDPATAGTVGFLIRLTFLVVATLTALRIAGLTPRTLAVGGAITAVVVGLAAQQTLGNLIAGLVLISARPFRVGDRVRLQAGGLAGQLEGNVASLGLLYTTFAQGQDSIMVPNNVVLSAAVVPLREPAAVDLRARLRPDVKPSQIQALLEEGVTTPVRAEPHIALEEVDRDEVVVRIAATPLIDSDGPQLADEVLAAIASVTREPGAVITDSFEPHGGDGLERHADALERRDDGRFERRDDGGAREDGTEVTATRDGKRRDGPDAGGRASGGEPSDRGSRVRPGTARAGGGDGPETSPITQEYES